MHHGDVFSGKVVVPRFVGQLVGVNVSWEPWAYGCLAGRRREGAILLQHRYQCSAAKAGDDATNTYLSMKHDVAGSERDDAQKS